MGLLYLTISAVSRCIYLYLLTKVTVRALPILSCDFDNGLNSGGCKDLNVYRNQDNFDWDIKSGPSNAKSSGGDKDRNTGPSNDHTRKDKTGKYLVINSSFKTEDYPPKNHFNGALASFYTNEISIPASRSLCLRFAYHMKGLTTGTLAVVLDEQNEETTIFQLSGEQGLDWKTARVWIPRRSRMKGKRTLSIKFKAILSYGYTSDIAIDDIKLETTRSSECRAWPPEAKPGEDQPRRWDSSNAPRDGPEDRVKCGKRKKETVELRRGLPQILGGKMTKPGQWPWMAFLCKPKCRKGKGERLRYAKCGGTLLGKNWIITAAHCVYDMENRDQLMVFLGVNSINKSLDDYIQERRIAEVYIHPHYHYEKPFNNDIAIIKLAEPADLGPDYVSSICLPGEDLDISEGQIFKITGYGRKGPADKFPDVLHEADVAIQECSHTLRPNDNMTYPETKLTDRMVCAGKDAGKHMTNTCMGDSGGPLMTKSKDKDHWVLAGITSWGSKTGCAKAYGVYTKVTATEILRWIKVVTNNYGEEFRLKFRDPDENRVITG